MGWNSCRAAMLSYLLENKMLTSQTRSKLSLDAQPIPSVASLPSCSPLRLQAEPLDTSSLSTRTPLFTEVLRGKLLMVHEEQI